MKTCFKCHQVKPLSEFYRHSKMADGHFNKCKNCAKIDARMARVANPEYYANFERERRKLPKRKALSRKHVRAYKLKYPQKFAAHRAVEYAIFTGRLTRCPCEICGQQIAQAHHDDYAKPLQVRWLCVKHHYEHHKNERLYARPF